MHRRQMSFSGVALVAASLALAVGSEAVASSTSPKVSIRIEGKTKTLLPATTVGTPTGQVTKDGHSCSAQSGAGVFNKATKGNWSGKWFTGLGFEPIKILGETDDFTTTKSYWELFVNNVAASTGLCGMTPLHSGEKILIAAVPATGTLYPIGLSAPLSATAGHSFTVKVVAYNAKGKASALVGATVKAGSERATSNAAGVVKLTDAHAGRLAVKALKKGYIRDSVTVSVKAS
jgi:hypothetical protein